MWSCSILEDMFYITGLPVDGSPIVCGEFNQEKILEDMLGADDPKRKGAYVSKEWLRKRFEKVREEDIQDENTRTIWLQRYARAYLLFLMGTILFPEKHKHTVFIGYLLFFTDLTPRVVQSFAWGAAVLAKLRDGFKQQTIKNGAVWILEMFLLERIPLLRKEYLKISEDTTSTQFPSVLHWSELMKNISANMHLTLDWESLLDQTEGDMQAAEISWRPYR
ncbi:hypothetical protein POM88_037160 [Heracleum sosnowskyi]|uniref:Aminotransferase-like plant mobile domain-containing protein n=1 Tax=Heracleum sosnowskyi TaxID=360622 RepID=A0AAD8HRE1_9APIA|nr:hypothetical protein POM88_037160 [Heracleum sosnowskyi]